MKTMIKILCLISTCSIGTATIKASPTPATIVGGGILAGLFSYAFPKTTIITALSLQTLAGAVIGRLLLKQSRNDAPYTPMFKKKRKAFSALYFEISAASLAGLIGYIASPYSKG